MLEHNIKSFKSFDVFGKSNPLFAVTLQLHIVNRQYAYKYVYKFYHSIQFMKLGRCPKAPWPMGSLPSQSLLDRGFSDGHTTKFEPCHRSGSFYQLINTFDFKIRVLIKISFKSIEWYFKKNRNSKSTKRNEVP